MTDKELKLLRQQVRNMIPDSDPKVGDKWLDEWLNSYSPAFGAEPINFSFREVSDALYRIEYGVY